MKGKPLPTVFRGRYPGPRELRRRAFDAVFEKAEKPKPRVPEYRQTTPDDADEPRND